MAQNLFYNQKVYLVRSEAAQTTRRQKSSAQPHSKSMCGLASVLRCSWRTRKKLPCMFLHQARQRHALEAVVNKIFTQVGISSKKTNSVGPQLRGGPQCNLKATKNAYSEFGNVRRKQSELAPKAPAGQFMFHGPNEAV